MSSGNLLLHLVIYSKEHEAMIRHLSVNAGFHHVGVFVARFGGNEFTGFSVPLVFGDRCFILESADTPLLSVFIEVNGEAVFEVLKNMPIKNSISNVIESAAGIVTVSDRNDGRFLYKVRPASKTSMVFGKLCKGEITARITDKQIQIGTITVKNNTFNGSMAGVIVHDNGRVIVGAALAPDIAQLLTFH